jgi:hypothetical protein
VNIVLVRQRREIRRLRDLTGQWQYGGRELTAGTFNSFISHRSRNFEIRGLGLAHHPGMTFLEYLT